MPSTITAQVSVSMALFTASTSLKGRICTWSSKLIGALIAGLSVTATAA